MSAAAPAAAQSNNAQAAPQNQYASPSLYVGDLHPDVNEAQLFDLFSNVGPVNSIRVCRDTVTRRSLGYAYVNFQNVNDAERALDTMNFTSIKGRPCRIMWCHRDPSVRKSGIGNVFIKNLDATIDNKVLYDTFSNFGNILSCKVVTDEHGNSRGYGFVHYETQEAADQAIEKVNNMEIAGKTVKVEPFVPKKDRQGEDGGKRFTNVFVKNLDEGVDEEQLKKEFAELGEITSAIIMRDSEGKSRGFGFVNFETPEAAGKAVDEMNGKEVNGKALFVGRAQKKTERENELRRKWESIKQERMNKYQGVNLYVKNLGDNMDDEKLREEFAPYGNITSCKVMRDEKGVSRGFGFVCFTSPEEATKAVTEMNGKLVGNKPLYVSLAQRKEVRRAQLEAQHAQRQNGMRMQQPNMGMQQPGMYPGAPMFYANPAAGMPPPPNRAFVYGQPMMPRGQWRGPAGPGQSGRPGYQPMPNYVVPMAQRQGQAGGPKRQRAVPQQAGLKGNRPGMAGSAANGQGRFKYTANARNNRDAMQMPPEMMQAHPGQLTVTALASAPPETQKQMLGERLFPMIHAEQPQLAGKITGMLLEMDNAELLVLLENQEALHSKIHEALMVLQEHQASMPEPGAEQDAGADQAAEQTGDAAPVASEGKDQAAGVTNAGTEASA